MSTQAPHDPWTPLPQPPKPKQHPFRTLFAVIGAVVLALVVIGLFSDAASDTPDRDPADVNTDTARVAAAPAPAETVTERVTEQAAPAPTVTTTETVEVAQTPQVCRDALNTARRGFTLAGEGFGIVSEIMGAASTFDVAGMTEAGDRLAAKGDEIAPMRATFDAEAAQCEATP